MTVSRSHWPSITILVVTCLMVGLLTQGCDIDSAKPATPKLGVEGHSGQLHNLGWMGAKSTPLKQIVVVADPNKKEGPVSTGGILLKQLYESGPLEKAGAKTSDVILAVNENWLPIKTDPTFDFVRLVEDCIDRQNEKAEIKILRDGKYEILELVLAKGSLDEGLPFTNDRSLSAITGALDQLVSLQGDDGSFPTVKDDDDTQLMSSAIAGLALISADESVASKYQSSLDSCLRFVSRRYSESNLPETSPLTASYVIQFIAESEVDFLEENWLDVIAELTERIYQQQTEVGSWEVEPRGEPTVCVNPSSTFVTNQVLLAIGGLERKGFDSSPKALEKACRYLADQTKARIPSRMDPRTKAILSAGTAAALVAINCDRNDEELNRRLDECLDRLADFHSSPELGWPGLFHVALLTRQFGNETWLRFHNATKYLTSSLYDPDGMVTDLPTISSNALEFEGWVDPRVWRIAHLVISQSMQSNSLKRSLAMEQPESMVTRDYLGKKFVPPISPDEKAERAKRAAELTKMIMEQLKESGMDVDEAALKRQPSKQNIDEK